MLSIILIILVSYLLIKVFHFRKFIKGHLQNAHKFYWWNWIEKEDNDLSIVNYMNMYNNLWKTFLIVFDYEHNCDHNYLEEWKHMYIETLGNWKTIDIKRCEDNYQTLHNALLNGKIDEKQYYEKFKTINFNSFFI